MSIFSHPVPGTVKDQVLEPKMTQQHARDSPSFYFRQVLATPLASFRHHPDASRREQLEGILLINCPVECLHNPLSVL